MRKLKQYDHAALLEAVKAVRNKSMSVRKAALEFNVPRSTISDKVTGRSDLETNMGRPPSLPSEIESKLVGNVVEASRRGIGISRKQLFARTGILCKRMKVAAFKNNASGRDWWNGIKNGTLSSQFENRKS